MPPTLPTTTRALVLEINAHDTEAAAWTHGSTIKRLTGDEYGARINDAHADMHRDLARIKRDALDKLNADHELEVA